MNLFLCSLFHHSFRAFYFSCYWSFNLYVHMNKYNHLMKFNSFDCERCKYKSKISKNLNKNGSKLHLHGMSLLDSKIITFLNKLSYEHHSIAAFYVYEHDCFTIWHWNHFINFKKMRILSMTSMNWHYILFLLSYRNNRCLFFLFFFQYFSVHII